MDNREEKIHDLTNALRGDPTGPRPEITEEELNGIVEVALHPNLFDPFVDWLRSRGLDLSEPIPNADGEGSFRIVSIP